MTDIALQPIDDAGALDAILFAGDLISDDSLRTAVLISLFTDAEVPEAEGDRRGWWADGLSAIDGDRIGSRLWLLDRSKATPEVASQANDYVRQALQWLIDDGVARSVTVQLAFDAQHQLVGPIEIARPTGTLQLRLETLWAANLVDPLDGPNFIAADDADISAIYGRVYNQQMPRIVTGGQ